MKANNFWIKGSAIILVFIVSHAAVNNLDDETPVALIKKIVKDVSYRPDEQSDWELAKTGKPLADGEEIRTGYRSLALVLFTDGSGLLRVRENSILHIYGERQGDKIDKNTFINKGKVGFDVAKQSEDESFKFTTPTVVASIRGTEGLINVADDSTTTVICQIGLIALNSVLGTQSSGNVEGGSTAIIRKDGSIEVRKSTDEENNEVDKTKQNETNKVKIKTNEGSIEIEYLPDAKK
ncbi:MAG: FecR family protein [Ignavibacteria bacterium]|jgi:hypothetical protein